MTVNNRNQSYSPDHFNIYGNKSTCSIFSNTPGVCLSSPQEAEAGRMLEHRSSRVHVIFPGPLYYKWERREKREERKGGSSLNKKKALSNLSYFL